MGLSIVEYVPAPATIKAHDAAYGRVFDAVRGMIVREARAATLELEPLHIGSTAVPGIAAKPIVDVLVPCAGAFKPVLAVMWRLGFQPTPFEHIPPDRPMVAGAIVLDGKRYNVHVHLTPRGSDTHRDNLLFRDALRTSGSLAHEYERVKREAVAAGRIEPVAYNTYKAPFIRSVLDRRNVGRGGSQAEMLVKGRTAADG